MSYVPSPQALISQSLGNSNFPDSLRRGSVERIVLEPYLGVREVASREPIVVELRLVLEEVSSRLPHDLSGVCRLAL